MRAAGKALPFLLLPFVLLACERGRGSSTAHGSTTDTLWLLAAEPADDAVHAADTEATLRARYGEENVTRDRVHLGEGETAPGTVLFAHDPARRLTVLWTDSLARTRPERVEVGRSRTRWIVYPGVSLGTTLKTLEQLNGRPFDLFGFAFDYAGTVADWKGGRLDSLWAGDATGGKRVWLRLQPDPESNAALLDQVAGERIFSSAMPAMQQLDPRVYAMFIEPR